MNPQCECVPLCGCCGVVVMAWRHCHLSSWPAGRARQTTPTRTCSSCDARAQGFEHVRRVCVPTPAAPHTSRSCLGIQLRQATLESGRHMPLPSQLTHAGRMRVPSRCVLHVECLGVCIVVRAVWLVAGGVESARWLWCAWWHRTSRPTVGRGAHFGGPYRLSVCAMGWGRGGRLWVWPCVARCGCATRSTHHYAGAPLLSQLLVRVCGGVRAHTTHGTRACAARVRVVGEGVCMGVH